MNYLNTLVLVSICCLSGCAVYTKQDYLTEKRAIAVSQGASVDYADGFQTACEGIYESRFMKDIARARQSGQYEHGWQDGRQYCQQEADRVREFLRDEPYFYHRPYYYDRYYY